MSLAGVFIVWYAIKFIVNQAKIGEFQNQPVASPPRGVSKAVYEGKTVHCLSAACCDIHSQLFDEDVKLTCYPSGGIAGGGDGRCKQFVLDKPALSTVRQDARPYVAVKRVIPNLPRCNPSPILLFAAVG